MGLGTLGADAADALRRPRLSCRRLEPQPSAIEGVDCFHGEAQIEAFLRQTDILVCLLPLTPDTRHILNRDVFTKLNRNSPLGAPVLINAGRGGLQNEADILRLPRRRHARCGLARRLRTEPLPKDSPFWTHPKVVLTPHNAADTDPDEISKYVARADRALRGRRRAGECGGSQTGILGRAGPAR